MIKKREDKLTFYGLFAISILVLFLLTYITLIKERIIEYISFNNDPLDVIYYNNIFTNMHFSISITIVLITVIIIFKKEVINSLNQISDEYLAWFFILISVILQIIIALYVKTEPIADSKFYLDHANRLFTTGYYLNEYNHPTAFWPIGLPALISLFQHINSDPILLVRFSNIIVSSIYIYTVDSFFRQSLSKKQRIIFLLLFVLYPNHLFSVNVILTDFPFAALLWIILNLISKKKLKIFHFILIGILTASMTYLRPLGLVMPFVIFILLFNNNKLRYAVKMTSVIVLTLFILLSPWIYRNYLVFGTPVIVATNGGFNFLMGNHKNSNGGVNFDFNYSVENSNEPQEELKAYQTSFHDVIENPLQSILRLPKKIFYSYWRGDSSITWSLKKTSNTISPIFTSSIFFMTNFIFYAIISLSIAGFYHKGFGDLIFIKKRIIIYSFLVFISLIIFYVGGERYIIPIMPIHIYYFAKYFDK
ncbi:MAG: hypothetical protein NTX65_00185 [Ignavibacteriales bacterium]|nr:hypothetical protein [Ignavibacteriales bacterium]